MDAAVRLIEYWSNDSSLPVEVPYRRMATEAATLLQAKPIASVRSASGRLYLDVAGIAVTLEGEVCRDAELIAAYGIERVPTRGDTIPDYLWDAGLMEFAATKMNDAIGAKA